MSFGFTRNNRVSDPGTSHFPHSRPRIRETKVDSTDNRHVSVSRLTPDLCGKTLARSYTDRCLICIKSHSWIPLPKDSGDGTQEFQVLVNLYVSSLIIIYWLRRERFGLESDVRMTLSKQ